MDTIARVRRAFYVQRWSMKKIVRELHVSRNTVRKILRSDETDFSYERTHQPMLRIGPWQDQLYRLLATNAGKPSRERLALIRIFEELRALGYEGGYDAIRRFSRTCTRGIYDNMKTAVEAVFSGKERLYNRRFLQMCSHYLVQPPSIGLGPMAPQ